MTEASGDILSKAAAPRPFDVNNAMRWVRQTHGKSALRQFAEILPLLRRPNLLQPKDYYLNGLFRPEFDSAIRRTYVSHAGSHELNLRLSPVHALSYHGLTFNKILAGALLERLGVRTPPLRAWFPGEPGLPGARPLRTVADLAEWLSDPGSLPCFGKPVFSSNSIGAAAFLEISDDRRQIRLGDGREVAIDAVCAQIARDFPRGYIFQPLLRQRPEVEALNGPAVGALRVVTLRVSAGPEVLYTVLKMPPAGAMFDGAANRRTNAMALVDPGSGLILRAQDMGRMAPAALEAAPATGQDLAGVVLPDVAEAVALACELHRHFPTHGVLGFDVALTVDGPCVTEVNTRPYHTIFQRAADRGMLNPDFLPRIEEACGISRRLAPDKAERLGSMTGAHDA
jgi:hypothetical protein